MAEQLICNQQVDGSTPFTSSIFYGGIPERPKGADCKSVVTDFAGPNPASPTKNPRAKAFGFFICVACVDKNVSLFTNNESYDIIYVILYLNCNFCKKIVIWPFTIDNNYVSIYNVLMMAFSCRKSEINILKEKRLSIFANFFANYIAYLKEETNYAELK